VTTPDTELIDRFLKGDTNAFGELVVRHQDRLFNTLVSMLRSHEEARDVAQEAFLHAFEKLSAFRGDSAFYSWLFRIAMNAAISRKRRASRILTSLDTLRETFGTETVDVNPTAEPSHQLDTAERRQLVRDAMNSLPDEFRTVLVLKEIEGLRYEDIAELVGCPIGTVRSRIHRARTELRARLQRVFGEDF